MRRLLTIALVIALMAIVVNDASHYFLAYVDLRNSTDELADSVASVAGSVQADRLGQKIADLAAGLKIRVTRYAMTPGQITLWTQENATGTWLLGPYLALRQGVPLEQALHTPIVITYVATAGLR